MKKKLYPITILLITAAFGLSSCLKESKYYVNLSQGKPLAELPLASYNGGSSNLVPEALAISSTPTVVPTIVNIASVSALSTATTITLELDPGAVATYNAANSTNYTLLPAADYSVTSWTVTVPAGQHTATFNLSINTTLVDPAGQFVLPIKIANASGLTIDQYNELLYNVQAKNAYDDNYTATGYVFHPTAPRPISATYAVTTVGSIRCQAPLADLGASNYYFDFDVQPASGGVSALANWSAFGSTPAVPASGFMTADNPLNQAYAPATDGNGLPGGAFYNITNFNNTYVVSSKTFLMHFGYASGGNGQATFSRQFYMKLVGE
jgi:hypothetical protein